MRNAIVVFSLLLALGACGDSGATNPQPTYDGTWSASGITTNGAVNSFDLEITVDGASCTWSMTIAGAASEVHPCTIDVDGQLASIYAQLNDHDQLENTYWTVSANSLSFAQVRGQMFGSLYNTSEVSYGIPLQAVTFNK